MDKEHSWTIIQTSVTLIQDTKSPGWQTTTMGKTNEWQSVSVTISQLRDLGILHVSACQRGR